MSLVPPSPHFPCGNLTVLVHPPFSRSRAAFLVATLIVGAPCGADALCSWVAQNEDASPAAPDFAVVVGWLEDARFEQAIAAIEPALATCAESERARWRQLRSRALRLASRHRDPTALSDALFCVEAARSAGDARLTAEALFDLGALHLVLGDLGAATAALEDSLAACATAGAAADAQRADVWIYLAECALKRLDYERARELYGEAAAIQERVLHPGDPRVAFRLVREANLAHRDLEPERALELGLRALDTFRVRLRPDHPRIATALHNLGTYRQRLGDLAGAASALEDAVHIRRSEGSMLVGNSLMLLAQVREQLGDDEAASRFNEEAIVWIEHARGLDAPELRIPLRDLALSALRDQDADAAERHTRRAIELFGPDDGASIEERVAFDEILGHIAWQRGQRQFAAAVWRKALTTLEEAEDCESDTAADLLCNLGISKAASGAADEVALAPALLERAVAIRRGTVSSVHPDLAYTLACFAEAAHAAARGDDAFVAALEAASIVRQHIDGSTLRLDERDALGYATELTTELTHGLPLAVVLATQSSGTRAAAAWDAVVAARAAVFESVRTNRAAQCVGPGIDAHASPTNSACTKAPLGIADVARAREDRVALVAYVRCTRPDAYVAFVLAAGSNEPHAIDLGSAVEIDAIAAPVCALARGAGSESAWREVATPLRLRVWDPIAHLLEGAREIHVVPDGALLLVDFASLPVNSSEYLIETAPPIHVLGAERDVVAARAKGPIRAGRTESMLAVGGPDYGTAATTDSTVTRDQRSPVALFPPLTHAADEARDVARSWSARGIKTRVLAGADATEAALRGALEGVRIVHIATHGFSNSTSGAEAGRGIAKKAIAPTPLSMRLGLSRRHIGTSGLALAGANSRRDTESDDDGVLFDEDVIALDLRHLDLAILSACDSGAGEIQSGEGIFGLRRAFSMAGARTVVASSWPVADETARTIMTDFHARLARGGTSVARALHDAKRAELARRRAAGLDTHPWHWAGFSAAGEPLTIR